MTCFKWNGEFYISGPDVFNAQCALYRLEHKKSVPFRRKFEESILAQLRSLPNEHVIIEDTGSPFIQYLYSLGAIRTRKRQKVYLWDAIKVD